MLKKYLNKIVKVVIDRPLNSKHPKFKFIYPINYGFIENTLAPDNEEIDAYVLDADVPLKEYMGKVIAIIHRKMILRTNLLFQIKISLWKKLQT